MSDEDFTPFKQKLILAILPAFVTAVTVVLGLGVQWYFFWEKMNSDQQESQAKLKIDQDKLSNEIRQSAIAIENAEKLSSLQRSKEFRLKFYERQMEFLTDLACMASRIAMAPRLREVKADIDKLKGSVGPMMILADDETRKAVIAFWNELDGTPFDQPVPEKKRLQLHRLSIAIGRECQRTVAKTFELDKKVWGTLGTDDFPPPQEPPK